VLADNATVRKLAGGFFNISGGAVDGDGNIYFVDAKWQSIYRWSPLDGQVTLLRNDPLEPVQLAFDKAGNLLVISYAGKGTVYSFKPGAPDDAITLLKPEPAAAHPGLTAILPVDYWRNENDFVEAATKKKPFQYISPDGTTFIPTGEDFVNGELYYGAKMHDVLRAFGLAPAPVTRPFYVTNEEQQKTYSASVAADGTLTNLRLFVERGGESVTEDAAGNVYIAAGQVYVYDPSGKQIATIEIPERPSQILFGGGDGKTLFILARSSLYAVQGRFKGR
jgi:sugar lactone lactonase YvrE